MRLITTDSRLRRQWTSQSLYSLGTGSCTVGDRHPGIASKSDSSIPSQNVQMYPVSFPVLSILVTKQLRSWDVRWCMQYCLILSLSLTATVSVSASLPLSQSQPRCHCLSLSLAATVSVSALLPLSQSQPHCHCLSLSLAATVSISASLRSGCGMRSSLCSLIQGLIQMKTRNPLSRHQAKLGHSFRLASAV